MIPILLLQVNVPKKIPAYHVVLIDCWLLFSIASARVNTLAALMGGGGGGGGGGCGGVWTKHFN